MTKKINIIEDKCTKCNLCIEVCPKLIFTKNGNDFPIIQNEHKCIECGHCLAICPVDAVDYKSFSKGEVIGKIAQANFDIGPLLASIRSVRKYKEIVVDDKLLNELINTASCSPNASNWNNVSYYIITDKEKIKYLAKIIINRFISLLKKLNSYVRFFISIFSKSTYDYITRMRPTIKDLINKYNSGLNPIFHNAPVVILFVAAKSNRMSKDNVSGQLHYMRIAAHAKGLGTCIIGYAITNHKIIEKALKIDKNKQIYGVLSIGYPKYNYSKMIFRKSSNIILN